METPRRPWHSRGMSPLDKAVQTLSVLVGQADVNGIALAERAVDDYLATFTDPHQRLGALEELDRTIDGLDENASAESREFLILAEEYLNRHRRALRNPE